MRINKFVAAATGLSRRAADTAIQSGRVRQNGQLARLGDLVVESSTVTLDDHVIQLPAKHLTVLLHKPVGYVSSRKGQGSQTIYGLLPPELAALKPVGRLDKDSSGLMLLTNDGDLAHRLSHPSNVKTKIYEITLNKALLPEHHQLIKEGVKLEDGLSKLDLEAMDKSGLNWRVCMVEGRNRQIRRTFASLSYNVQRLHRTHFGPYQLGALSAGAHKSVEIIDI